MKKIPVIVIGVLFIGISIIPPTGGIGDNHTNFADNKTELIGETESIDNETEYYALLIAVGVYAGHPEEDRPSMIADVEDLHEMLLVSEHWKEENIKFIKGEKATFLNIIRGFRWLDKREDENDFSLVYITTHGGPLSRDIFPWDEEDGCDEILATYLSFIFPWLNIRDDFLNLMLSLLNSKGVCVVIESCHAGGFNDPPYFKSAKKENRMNVEEWMHEFAEDVRGSGRVVLMSCREDEQSHAGFAPCLTEALTGYADANEDELVSAEEAFDYVVENFNDYWMHPTIYDDYPGELQLTEVELPPSMPEGPFGQIIGNTNTTYNYSTVSIDPEGGKINYGWDLNSDDIVDEWSDFLDSGIWHNISLSWSIEGTYNIKVKAVDGRGVECDWSNRTTVSMSSDHVPDQRQTEIGGGIGMNEFWVAQKFIPTLNTLSKVELVIGSEGNGEPKHIHMYIRDELNGENLAETTRGIPPYGYKKSAWFTFDFEDLDVTPGNVYYIVCEKIGVGWGYSIRWMDGNPYPHGAFFHSSDGNNWSKFLDADGCFVTWG